MLMLFPQTASIVDLISGPLTAGIAYLRKRSHAVLGEENSHLYSYGIGGLLVYGTPYTNMRYLKNYADSDDIDALETLIYPGFQAIAASSNLAPSTNVDIKTEDSAK